MTLDVYGTIAALNRTGDAHTGTVTASQVGTGSRATVKVGARLHIAVVTAPFAGVPPDSLCSYNVTLEVTDTAAGGGTDWSGRWDLGGLKLLDQGDPSDDYQGGLGYQAGQLPTFRTPPSDVADLRLYHGSCFKMHGEGPSIMANIDDLFIDETPDHRPHLLLLTGDQIYADDVATALSPLLTTIGATLLSPSSPETVPVPGSPDGNVAVSQTNFPAGRRLKLIRVTAGMSSDDADNHLIGFGEWAALYLLCWSGRLENRQVGTSTPVWPQHLSLLPEEAAHQSDHPVEGNDTDNTAGASTTLDPSPVVTLDPGAAAGDIDSLLTDLTSPGGQDRLAKLLKTFRSDRTKVIKIGSDGDKVRRALANVPVLTICDDHEVTDDWFITGAWRARVLGSTLGRAMVRNALIAYVLFQGWGNTPDRFATAGTPEAQFLDLVPQLFDGAGPLPSANVCTQIDHLLGLDDKTGSGGGDDPNQPGGATRIAFGYHLDLSGSRLVVLDTRTHREYGTPDGPPGLLSAAALDIQLPTTLTDNMPVLIVVSPAPVLGPRLLEEIIAPLAVRGYDAWTMAFGNAAKAADVGYDIRKPDGPLYFDVESWSARPVAFERFLDRLTRCPSVVMLAGDVHYAASFTMDYTRFTVPADEGGVPPADPAPSSPASRIVHFTASAIRNAWDPAVTAIASSVSILEHLEQIGFTGATMGWHRMDPPVLTGGDAASGEPRPLRARLRREPVLLPTSGWAAAHPVRPPEWMYRVAPISDARTDDIRFADLATAGFTTVLAPSVPDAPVPPLDNSVTDSWVDASGPYDTATGLHAANVEGGAISRTIVWGNNVGVVTFARNPGDALSVQMACYFVRAHPVSDDEKPHPYVVHSAALTPNPLTAPDHVGGS